MTLGKWVKKARESGRVPDKDLSENERAELERLRKENATLRMERDFAKKGLAPDARRRPARTPPPSVEAHHRGWSAAGRRAGPDRAGLHRRGAQHPLVW